MRLMWLSVSLVLSFVAIGMALLFIGSATVQHWQIVGVSLVPIMGICNLAAMSIYGSCLNLTKPLKRVLFGWLTVAALCLLTGIILALAKR